MTHNYSRCHIRRTVVQSVFVVLTLFFLTAFFPSAPRATAEENTPPDVTPSEPLPTLVVIPDTQEYLDAPVNTGIFLLMTEWIAEHRESDHLIAALHVGDIIDKRIDRQWTEAVSILGRLAGKIPTVLATGNHEYGGAKSADSRITRFDEFFPTDWNPANESHLVAIGPNAEGKRTLENAAYRFDISDAWKLLVVSLEFAPSKRAVAWAKEVVARPEFRDDRVIILTHSYIRDNGKRLEKESYHGEGFQYGQTLWEDLIYPSDNIRLVICGHIGRLHVEETSVFTVDENHAGKKVGQMLFDTQAVGDGNGGDGWIRLLELDPDGVTIHVKTFSPLFDISPVTRFAARNRAATCEFDFCLE